MVASRVEVQDRSKESVARRLAESHFKVDPAIRRIFRVVDRNREDHDDEPVKLLEVNEDTIATGIQPLGFPAHEPSGIYYPSLIIEVRPEELELLEKGSLHLPTNWTLGKEYTRNGA